MTNKPEIFDGKKLLADGTYVDMSVPTRNGKDGRVLLTQGEIAEMEQAAALAELNRPIELQKAIEKKRRSLYEEETDPLAIKAILAQTSEEAEAFKASARAIKATIKENNPDVIKKG